MTYMIVFFFYHGKASGRIKRLCGIKIQKVNVQRIFIRLRRLFRVFLLCRRLIDTIGILKQQTHDNVSVCTTITFPAC